MHGKRNNLYTYIYTYHMVQSNGRKNNSLTVHVRVRIRPRYMVPVLGQWTDNKLFTHQEQKALSRFMIVKKLVVLALSFRQLNALVLSA